VFITKLCAYLNVRLPWGYFLGSLFFGLGFGFFFNLNNHHQLRLLNHSIQYITLRNVLLHNMLKGGCDFARKNKADLELTDLEWKCKDWIGASYFHPSFP